MKHLGIIRKAAACLVFCFIVIFGFRDQAVAMEGPGMTDKASLSAGPNSDDRKEVENAANVNDSPETANMAVGPQWGPGAASSSGNLKFGPGGNIFGGGSLSMLADSGNRQMLALLLQAADGTLVVVDGGWSDDSGHLKDVIRSRGGRVSGWFITHPHSDHAGALMDILNDPNSQITIDNVYYHFTDQAWYDAHGNGREAFVKSLEQALAKLPAERLHGNVTKGQEIRTGSIKAVVMNSPYLLDTTSVNNSSVVYKFYLNGVSLLVLGDMGPEGGQLLLADHPDGDLKSDFVQMSHHGQYGVGREVYAAIAPQAALWPCPLWLWNNDSGAGKGSGSWKTLETRQWMEELGVKANYCIKDGDQTVY